MAPASSGYDRQTAPSSRYREVAVVRSPPMQVASPGHTRRYLSPGMRHRSPVYRPPSPPSSTFREVAYVHRGSPSRRDTPDMSPGMRHRSPVYRPPSPPSSTFREVTYVHRGSPSRRDTPDMRYSVPFSARKALGGTLQSSPEQLDSARSSERSVFIPADATPMNVGRRPPSRTLLPQQRASDPLVNALQGQSNGPRRPPSPTLLSQQRALDPLVNALQGRSHGSRRSPSPTLLSQQRASDPLADALQGRSHGPRRSPSPTLLPRQRALDPLAEQRAPDPLVNALQGQSNGPRRPPSPTLLSQQSASDPLVNSLCYFDRANLGMDLYQLVALTSSSRVLSRQAPKADDAPWYAERLPADLEHEIRMLEAKTSIDSYPRDAVQRHLNATEHYQGRPQYLGRPTEGPRRGDALATGKALKMANFDMSWEERKEHTLSKPFQKNMPPKVQKSGMYSGWPMEDDRPVVTLEEKPGTVRAFGKDGKVVASTITVWVLDMVGRKHPIVTTTDDDVIGLRYKIMKLPWIKEIEGTWKIHGGHEIILQRKAIDKWTGTEVTLTLENGDGFEHIPTGTFIQDGTLIEPVFDDSAYELQAVQNSLDVKGMIGTIFRGTGMENL